MFPGVPHSVFHVHDWRNGVVSLGEVPASLVQRVSEGKLDFSVKVELDRLLVETRWDAIISVGQLVPHEVIGIANHAKNVFVGVGGSDLINKSHWLGAVYGIERIMGRASNPVREVLNYASDRFLKDIPIVYVHTVVGRNTQGRLAVRGLFIGDDVECFHRAADLSPLAAAARQAGLTGPEITRTLDSARRTSQAHPEPRGREADGGS